MFIGNLTNGPPLKKTLKCASLGSSVRSPVLPSPGRGSALALLRGLVVVLRQPLPTDILHHRVLRSLGGLKDVLDQRAGSARIQFHRQQVRGPQLTAHQVGFDLAFCALYLQNQTFQLLGLKPDRR